VKGDPSRLSTVVAEKPFMGLLPDSQTSSWSEPVYAEAWCVIVIIARALISSD
jgi:hypothetical protein